MSVLGVVLRVLPAQAGPTVERLLALPGVDVMANPGDGRLVLVIEDTDAPDSSAAATLGAMTAWPEVLNTSLVYEYSGPDAPAPEGSSHDYRSWRSSLADLARTTGLGEPPTPHQAV